MVIRHAVRVASLLALLCLAGCEIFTVSPFPGFVDKTDISMDLGSRIRAITADVGPVNYDLNVIDRAGLAPRVLLLVEPPSSDPVAGFDYKGKLVVMDKDLNVLGEASTAGSLNYFSKPYSYAADTSNVTGFNILAGYTVLDENGVRKQTLTPTTLQGFAFTDGTTNYIFSTPAGQYASFDLNFATYSNIWGLLSSLQTFAIIPPAARPSTSDPNYANLGYQLVGIALNGTNITFVLSEPSQGRIVAERTTIVSATSGSGVLSTGSWPLSVTVDRPELHADANGFFLVQRDGWMTRYGWTPTGALSQVGDPKQIVGDRSLNRLYGFLLPQSGGTQYMYRFDPSSRILTRYMRWW